MSTSEKQKEKGVPKEVQADGLFIHHTGDTYDGGFKAKKDLTIKMNGPGDYKTADGDVYSGHWEGNVLSNDVKITYTDGSYYEGILKDWTYLGDGAYHYPDKAKIECEFKQNIPSGDIVLTDPNGHKWLGKAERGYCWVEPINHYFAHLENMAMEQERKRRIKAMRSEARF